MYLRQERNKKKDDKGKPGIQKLKEQRIIGNKQQGKIK